MVDAIQIAASSMKNDVRRLNVLSQNVANAITPGYKKGITINQLFNDYISASGVAQKAYAITLPQLDLVSDMKAGTLKFTGNPLDIAIEGDGFFEVQTDHGLVYTRNGSFHVDTQGKVVNESGWKLMGSSGDVTLSSSTPVIDKEGRIFNGDKEVAQLKTVRFADVKKLHSIGSGLYQAGDGSEIKTDGLDRIRQGHLEMSNVSSMVEMVKLMETMRHFESNQKLVQGYNEILERAIRTLGEV